MGYELAAATISAASALKAGATGTARSPRKSLRMFDFERLA